MAEIELQRKEQTFPAWIWVVLALLLIGLVLWWWMASQNNQAAVNTTNGSEVTTQQGMATANMPLAAIAANPDNYFGQEVSGMATITEVMSPSAFRVEQDGTAMFTYWAAAPTTGNTPTAGQRISMTATVRDPQNLQQYVDATFLEGATLGDLQNEPAFLVVSNGELQNGAAGTEAGGVGQTLEEAGEAVTPGTQ